MPHVPVIWHHWTVLQHHSVSTSDASEHIKKKGEGGEGQHGYKRELVSCWQFLSVNVSLPCFFGRIPVVSGQADGLFCFLWPQRGAAAPAQMLTGWVWSQHIPLQREAQAIPAAHSMQQERLPFTVCPYHVKMSYMLLKCTWKVLGAGVHAIVALPLPVWGKVIAKRELMSA